MMEKLKVRSTLMKRNFEMEEYLYLEDMFDASGGGEFNPWLRELLGEDCAVFLAEVDPNEHPSGDSLKPVKKLPRKHQRNIGLSAMAFLNTYDSRDPVLIVDVGEKIALVVMPATRLEEYIEKKYKQKVSLPTPADKYLRWVCSVAQDEELLCTKMGFSPSPNIARA